MTATKRKLTPAVPIARRRATAMGSGAPTVRRAGWQGGLRRRQHGPDGRLPQQLPGGGDGQTQAGGSLMTGTPTKPTCRNNCELASCGDGVRRDDLPANNPRYEACDDGNLEIGDVATWSVASSCGTTKSTRASSVMMATPSRVTVATLAARASCAATVKWTRAKRVMMEREQHRRVATTASPLAAVTTSADGPRAGRRGLRDV